MAFLVVIQPAAQSDIASIGQYIARDNPERARSYTEELVARTERLAQFPEIGSRLTRAADPNLREIIHGPYRIIYRVNPTAGAIEVLRFWHAARGEPQLYDEP